MRYTLKRNGDFRRLYKRGKVCATRSVVVYVTRPRYVVSHYGITVTKSIGNAVKRNRAKRVIRAAFRELRPYLNKEYDFVFVARNFTTECKSNVVLKDMRYAMRKLELLK